jgi:hypothetical protein
MGANFHFGYDWHVEYDAPSFDPRHVFHRGLDKGSYLVN